MIFVQNRARAARRGLRTQYAGEKQREMPAKALAAKPECAAAKPECAAAKPGGAALKHGPVFQRIEWQAAAEAGHTSGPGRTRKAAGRCR